ncbi:hypothetical protein P3102_37575 [Amycolatopsis sp. QT-25]|uniref:hypothetical protein n=1 Tax=Amycolatopsis sp. QT-25 TaxID=3034022 RepID=UPI0023EAF35A|nr:hypothetical protein [Amycolatopsis sp. QT-25]WET79654.1 hypothetical protein P3102_37575 [Amycolatopsis sp. QT-25]
MRRLLLLLVPVLLCAACVPRSGSEDEAAASPPPPRRFLLKETPSTEPPAVFQGGFVHNACAILTSDVLAAAGMALKDGFLQGGDRLSTTDGDRPELAGKGLWVSTCGGSVTVAGTSVSLHVLHSRFSRRTDWRDAVLEVGARQVSERSPEDIKVSLQTDYNILELGITGFTKLSDPEAALTTLLDGIRRKIAQGPRSMPIHSYPAPYDLVADPCAAFPADVFTTITERPTDGLQRDLFSLSETPGSKYNSVEMRCDRAGQVDLSEGIAPSVTVGQTVLSVPDSAVAAVREQCDFSRGEPLPRPIGEASCGDFGADGGQILFRGGRSMVQVSVVAAKTDPATTRENLLKGAEAVYARLTPSP